MTNHLRVLAKRIKMRLLINCMSSYGGTKGKLQRLQLFLERIVSSLSLTMFAGADLLAFPECTHRISFRGPL
jgi:hypothetical protein